MRVSSRPIYNNMYWYARVYNFVIIASNQILQVIFLNSKCFSVFPFIHFIRVDTLIHHLPVNLFFSSLNGFDGPELSKENGSLVSKFDSPCGSGRSIAIAPPEIL